MVDVPVLKPSEVVAILERLGFHKARQKGGHKQFRHDNGRGTTVPFHRGRDISPILLGKISGDIGRPFVSSWSTANRVNHRLQAAWPSAWLQANR
jgi:predicted RNA binding protein YcfA (HicA-like mRNA interferase family)